MNGFRLVAFPCAREDVDFMSTRMRRQRGGEAIFLEAAEREVIIEDETDLHYGMRAAGMRCGNAKSWKIVSSRG